MSNRSMVEDTEQVTLHQPWRRGINGLAAVAAVALLCLMLLTVADIIGRNSGIFYLEGVIEFSSVTVVLIGFFGFAQCFNDSGHIVIDVATRRGRARSRRLLDGIWNFIACLLFAAMGWLMSQEAIDRHLSGEVTENIQWPTIVYWVPAVLGAFAASATCAGLAVKRIRWT